MKKPFPTFKNDKEAEDFVDTADLSEYDFSDMRMVRFELNPKNKSVSLRLPESLLGAVRQRARKDGMPYQRFIRMAIEHSLRVPSQRPRKAKAKTR